MLSDYFNGGAYEVTASPTGSISATKKYYALGGVSILDDGSGLQYLLTDQQGSVVGVTNSSGTLTDSQRYMPFGQVRGDVNGITKTDFSYTGQRQLSGLNGLLDYRARFYDSSIGRFLQPDLIVSNPAGPQTWNRYSYVINNPVNMTDPTGHVGVGSTPLMCEDSAPHCKHGTGSVAHDDDKGGGGGNGGSNCYLLGDCDHHSRYTPAMPYGQYGSFGQYMTPAGYLAIAGGTLLFTSAWFGLPLVAGYLLKALGVGGPLCSLKPAECQQAITTLTQEDMPAIEQFVQDAIQKNGVERGVGSFGGLWSFQSKIMLVMGDPDNMFINRVGDKITGMMKVSTSGGFYEVNYLEGLGGGAGTNLFKQAIVDSMARGYNGSITLAAAPSAVEWYTTNFPGAQQSGNIFSWASQVAQDLLGGH